MTGAGGRGADPTAEEVAAVVAAVEVLWPKPARSDEPPAPSRWRFSGRWWTKPVPSRRDRPWQMADGYPPPPPGWFAFHPPPPAPRWAGYRLAGFWLRAGGYAVDASITALFTLPAMIVFFAGPWRTRDCSFPEDPFCEVPAAGTIAASVVLWLAAMAGAWAYHALTVARRGATPGGRLVGCQVVDLGTGQWPSLPKALGRHAFAVFVSGYFYWIGYLWMLWDPAGQTLHDKVTDTVVVEA